VAASALALNRIVSSAKTSVVFASGVHHAAATAWLAKLTMHRITYADAVGFAVIKDLKCAGFLSFDSDFLLAGFRPWTPE
jgi:predicted nucleic acid-binding protein